MITVTGFKGRKYIGTTVYLITVSNPGRDSYGQYTNHVTTRVVIGGKQECLAQLKSMGILVKDVRFINRTNEYYGDYW